MRQLHLHFLQFGLVEGPAQLVAGIFVEAGHGVFLDSVHKLLLERAIVLVTLLGKPEFELMKKM